MSIHVALSYAGEDAPFAEHVAGILKRFLGPDAVFHYSAGGQKRRIEDFLRFVNGVLTAPNRRSGDSFRMVCFVHRVNDERRIVVGQETELLDRVEGPPGQQPQRLMTWQGITNSGHAHGDVLKTIAVTLPNHALTADDLKRWSVRLHLNTFGQAILPCDFVTDNDRASAQLVAEFVLRDAYGLSPIAHACKAFTYEKDIISFYAGPLGDAGRSLEEFDDQCREAYKARFV